MTDTLLACTAYQTARRDIDNKRLGWIQAVKSLEDLIPSSRVLYMAGLAVIKLHGKPLPEAAAEVFPYPKPPVVVREWLEYRPPSGIRPKRFRYNCSSKRIEALERGVDLPDRFVSASFDVTDERIYIWANLKRYPFECTNCKEALAFNDGTHECRLL